ncbi:hypothetical protein SKAU_G00247330 [Synaphobranchus kaupii]|uniref:Gypsy retrotransposon integrase-like protein 1 n=1 Tax=Synaphobranchus kaupii TaxID=118154 RepID=A0A9Q1F261_SYNKA|nr:hypothetical protein SKAU_G00247330 [Synaphobranchus kaupii]
MSHAYQQLVLDPESRPVVTINTHKGLFQYTRLPFGVSSACAIFQRAMEGLLAGIDHVAIYLDDLLITGSNYQQHLETLQAVLPHLPAQTGEAYSKGAAFQRSKDLFSSTALLVHYDPALPLVIAADRITIWRAEEYSTNRVCSPSEVGPSADALLVQSSVQARPHYSTDGLSRLPLPQTATSPSITPELISLLQQLKTAPITSQQLMLWTRCDPLLSRVCRFVGEGWPVSCPSEDLLPFFKKRDELTVESGVLLWGMRVVVPPPGRETLLEELHDTHPGITRMKSTARAYMWWPGLGHRTGGPG